MIALAGQLLAILGTLTMGARFPPAALLCNLAFWVSLFLFLRDRGVRISDAVPFLPLLPLYYFTFFFHRGAPETMDYVFGSDTARYLQEALRFFAGPRHIGLGIFSFPLSFLNAVGAKSGMLPRLGHEYLYLQSALIGVMTVVLFFRLLHAVGGSSITAVLTSYAFAFSLASWTFSSLMESFMPSLLFLLVALEVTREIFRRGEARDCLALALVTLLALLMSLENVYFIALFPIALFARFKSPVDRRMARLAGLYAAVLLLGFLPLLAAARHSAGPEFYQDWAVGRLEGGTGSFHESMGRFVAFHSKVGRLLHPGAYLAGAYRAFVMSIRAQPGRPAMTYMWDLDGSSPLSPGNLAYYALLSGLLFISGRRLWKNLRSEDPESRYQLATVATILILRQLFVTFYAWRASILFSLPSIMVLWLLVGSGLVPDTRERERRETLLGNLAMALLAALLFASNGRYLLAIGLAAPPL